MIISSLKPQAGNSAFVINRSEAQQHRVYQRGEGRPQY